jgi:hypothetical protein
LRKETGLSPEYNMAMWGIYSKRSRMRVTEWKITERKHAHM